MDVTAAQHNQPRGPSARRVLFVALALTAAAAASTVFGQAQAPAAVVFENVRVLDSTGRLSAPSNVLVAGNVIKSISTAPIADPAGTTVERIRGNGRTLMPGLIDNHWHTMLASPPLALALNPVWQGAARPDPARGQRRCPPGPPPPPVLDGRPTR